MTAPLSRKAATAAELLNLNGGQDFKKGSRTQGGQDKVQRYKWQQIKEPGEFMWADKDELHIDHGYQRDKINNVRVNEMASSWDWVSCGALSVAERDDKWFVIDGQHRKLAADKRSDIKKLPCMVFPLESRKAEANAFVALNSQKTAVSGVDRFKAMIVAGDQTAIGLSQVLDSTGHKVSTFSSGKTVACIQCLWNMFRRDAAMFRVLWPLLSDMNPNSPIVDVLARGIWGAEIKAREKDLTLVTPPFRPALIQAGGAVLASEIRKEKTIVGHGGERIETSAVVKWINRLRLGSRYKLEV